MTPTASGFQPAPSARGDRETLTPLYFGMSKRTAQLPRFEDRTRFNWGYHEGVADVKAGRPLACYERQGITDAAHFDQVYVQGYRAGRAMAARPEGAPELSTEAWEARS